MALMILLPDVKPDYIKVSLGILKSVLAQAELYSASDCFYLLTQLLCVFSRYPCTTVRQAEKHAQCEMFVSSAHEGVVSHQLHNKNFFHVYLSAFSHLFA